MPLLRRSRHSQNAKSPTDPATPVTGDPTPEPVDPAPPSTTTPTTPVPRTRTGAAWFGICAAALTLVVLIIFMLQNTRRVAIHFLWMDGSLPLALALLIAGVGVGLLTMIVGTARLTQLRKQIRDRRQHH
jgi:putative membrane protein